MQGGIPAAPGYGDRVAQPDSRHEGQQTAGRLLHFPRYQQLFWQSAADKVINNADDFCEYLLHSAHVAVVTGSAFGADNCYRISYAASEKELREAIRRIAEAVNKLQ